MPKIANREAFNGADERLQRLGLVPLWLELEGILSSFDLRVKEEKDSNGGAAIRSMLDSRFKAAGGWKGTKTGGVDWIKCHTVNGCRVCLGVEIQFSARSDLLIVDVSHLKEKIQDGEIDVGAVVVPTDHLAYFLTDRVAYYTAALQAVERAEAGKFPLIVMGLEHDGPGEALAKQRTRQGR